jgi:hypothetical protein
MYVFNIRNIVKNNNEDKITEKGEREKQWEQGNLSIGT